MRLARVMLEMRQYDLDHHSTEDLHNANTMKKKQLWYFGSTFITTVVTSINEITLDANSFFPITLVYSLIMSPGPTIRSADPSGTCGK